MKTIKTALLIFSLITLVSCGPGQKEKDTQKQKEDSLMEIDRNNSLDNADKLLQMQDSSAAEKDTTAPAKK